MTNTLPQRITDFFVKIEGLRSLNQEQKDECLSLWGELKNYHAYCQVCSTVVTRAWTELKEWHEQQNKNR